MTKFYRVLKENFLWEKEAILEYKDGGYRPIDPIFIIHEDDSTEYISKGIVENSPDYFERVYPVNLVTKTVYKVKEEAKELIKKTFK